jgi:hypothetical protein
VLSEEEEHRLESYFVTVEELIEDHNRGPQFYVSAVQWLSSKLKEINEECSNVHLELQEANENLARAVDSGYY